MGHGSSVTYNAQPSSRQLHNAALAWAMASISAWEQTACFSSRAVPPPADHGPVPDDDAPHRDLTGIGGLPANFRA